MSEYDLNNPQSDVESYLANMDGILAPLPLPPESNVEKYLAHIVGVQGIELPNKPDSRVEAYLEKLALDPPQPVTPILVEKSVTENGVYSAGDDNADGYSKVTVEVPDPVLDDITITENGVYTSEHDGFDEVTVEVPDPVLDDITITENGVYTSEHDGFDEVTVEVAPPEDSYQLKSMTTPTSLATFEASEMPMPSLKVSVEAKQDLHGYDKPWVGGAGKNKLIDSGYVKGVIGWDGTTADTIVDNIHFITSPYVPINNNTVYTLSAIHGNIVRIYITDENHNTLYFSGNKPIEGSNVVIPAKSGAVYFRYSIGIDDEAVIPSDYGTKVYGQLELGSTATSYEPYSNICPISGWSEVKVSDVDDVDNPTVTQSTTISLPQTVYGGEVDVVNGTSGNKLKYGFVDLGTLNWAKGDTSVSGKYRFYATIEGDVESNIDNPHSISSHFGLVKSYETFYNLKDGYILGSDNKIYIYMESYNDYTVQDFVTAVTGVQLVYELATPTTLTTQPTPIKSLEGTNNLSVDCGEVIEGEYFKAL